MHGPLNVKLMYVQVLTWQT